MLATVGGFLGTAYLIISISLSSYLSFTYDKSMLKRIYAVEKEPFSDDVDPNSGLKRDAYSELSHQMHNRTEFSFSYTSYLLVRVLINCCCCLKRYCAAYEKQN